MEAPSAVDGIAVRIVPSAQRRIKEGVRAAVAVANLFCDPKDPMRDLVEVAVRDSTAQVLA